MNSTYVCVYSFTYTHTRARSLHPQNLSPAEYEAEKERVADDICRRLEAIFPGLCAAIEYREVRRCIV